MSNVLGKIKQLFSGGVSFVNIECERQLQKNISPGGASACVFTSIYMYLSVFVKMPGLQEFYDACTKTGLVRRKDAYIFDYDQIVKLAGIDEKNHKTNFDSLRARRLLDSGCPFLISTETHTELCNGFTEAPNGDLTFTVVDPHSKNDVAFNARDMKLYNKDGVCSGRTVKTMRWFE
jgi:hypothetical protein